MNGIFAAYFCFIASAAAYYQALSTSVSTGRSFLAKGVPLYTPPYLEISVLLLAASVLLVLGLAILRQRDRAYGQTPRIIEEEGAAQVSGRLKVILILIPFFCFALFAISPQLFHLLSIEDRSIEILSGILLFAVAGIFAAAAPRLGGRIYFILAASLAMIFFLAAGEEFSWFSRWLNLDAQWVRQLNNQGEVNLHNMNTNASEYVYYCGAFALLTLLPFVRDSVSKLRTVGFLKRFLPGREIVLISAPAAAFNFDNWNTPITQAMFFVTCAIIAVYALEGLRGGSPAKAILPAAMLLGLVIVQSGFLAFGHQQIRMWEIREYKELLIPAALLLFSVDFLRKASEASKTIPSETAELTERKISPSLPQETLDPL